MTDINWYLSKSDKIIGPFSNHAIMNLIRRGEVNAMTLVWKEGTANWLEARLYPELKMYFEQPREPSPLAGQPTLDARTIHSEKKVNNYFQRHWNGENSLAWAWWVNGFLLNIPILTIDLLLTEEEVLTGALSALFYILFLLCIYTWQLVGISRSAIRYIHKAKEQVPQKSGAWGNLAIIGVVLGIINTFGTTVPVILDAITLIELEQESISQQYYIQYNGNTDVVLNGYINANSVSAVISAFEEDDSRSALVLNSLGGILRDAFILSDYILENELVVAAKGDCVSACVLLLASAKIALATPDTEIIFHHPVDRAEFVSAEMERGLPGKTAPTQT